LWWKAQLLHQWICKDYSKRKAFFNEERMALQQQLIEEEANLMKSPCSPSTIGSFSSTCLSLVTQTISRWYESTQ
jgi:hypothetical protein